MSEAYVT